jgi:IclR family KDG regulon transcriptional repressor
MLYFSAITLQDNELCSGVEIVQNRAKDVLKLLEVFCRNNHPIGITELSNMLLEGKSSVFQAIKILEELEYLEQEPHTKKYALTTKLLELVNTSLRGYYERTNIHRYLKQIAEKTGECTYFGLRNKKNLVVYVDRYASENALTVYTNIGDVPLPHCTAHGKALLAFLNLEEIEEVIKDGLQKYTEHTITDKQKLFEDLRKIRENGYAFDLEERVIGVRCVAVPVFNSRNEVIGALGVSGMIQNMSPERMESHAIALKSVAEKVSINVGNDLLF